MLFIIVASLGAVPIVANIVCFQCLPPAGLTVTTIGQFLSLHKIAVTWAHGTNWALFLLLGR